MSKWMDDRASFKTSFGLKVTSIVARWLSPKYHAVAIRAGSGRIKPSGPNTKFIGGPFSPIHFIIPFSQHSSAVKS